MDLAGNVRSKRIDLGWSKGGRTRIFPRCPACRKGKLIPRTPLTMRSEEPASEDQRSA